MAEAFLQVVLENLSSLTQGEIGLIMGVDEEMKKLSSTLTTIQAVLEDAEEKQLESKPIRNWLCKLNDLAYEIDDILDECATHISKLKFRNSKLSRYSLKKVLFRHNIGRRMKQAAKNLEAVAAERTKFHLQEMPVERDREVATARETGSVLHEPHHVYGREEDKEKIVQILVDHIKNNQEISVLPVIGVGGLGKTTLAQLVINDLRVVEHFETRLWVCVSDNFNVKNLVKAIIESATESGIDSNLQHLDTLQRRLWKLLGQKRYLLVLDDVWNDHQEKWFEFRNILACGSTGTSIILTTRQKKVADLMGTLPAYHLMGLTEEHCWMLLRQRAFGKEEEVCPDLEAIGKQIVKKCAGVPLAAKALGGLLRFKRKEEDWIYVKESEMWNLPQERLILPALRLSYHHLPFALRQCFAYCAVFPKDTEIEKEELIFLWMAHGCISSKGKLEMEDVGEDICNELVLRSILQVLGPNTLHMHDLVHDLTQSIMENKVPGTQAKRNVASTYNRKIRQVNFRNKYIAFPASPQLDMNMSSIIMKFGRLRVFDASRAGVEFLPGAVGNLKHLRYLNLSESEICTLPSSLCSLWNLQILNLNHCTRLVALPKKMRYLKNLRYLCLESCTSLSKMPSKIRQLTCLRSLSLFIVSSTNLLEELQCLKLGGKLEIQHLERVKNHVDAQKANLVGKKNLRHLSLVWETNSASKSREHADGKVLEALQPHPNVETLRISGFGGSCFPAWMTNLTLAKVVQIEIVDCPNSSCLPQLGELPHLKVLRLGNLAVKYIIVDEVEGGNPAISTQFPSLETLQLCCLPNLTGLLHEQVSKEAFPNLVNLKIEGCTSLILRPLPSLQALEAMNCSSLTLASFSKLDTLTFLELIIDDNMKRIPVETLESLTNLKSLAISQAQEQSLPQAGLRAMKSLTQLLIEGCKTLTCLPQGWLRHLKSLKYMRILRCAELVELPEEIKYLHHIKILNLTYLPKMVCLPKALRHLSSMETLALHSLPQLDSLPDWLDHLTSLRRLYIVGCPKLISLPASIRGMPNLEHLYVGECPELERRCERGNGEDWHKIATIPYLRIGHDN